MSRMLVLLFALVMSIVLHGVEETAPAFKASVESLVTQLGDDHFDKRNEAMAAIIKLGKPAIPELQTAQSTTKDPEIKSRLLDILEILQPPLELIVQPLGEAKAGQLLTFKIRIKNVSAREQTAVRCLNGSTTSTRYPHFTREILPEVPEPESKVFTGNMDLLPTDYCALQPGAAFDPMGAGGYGQSVQEWTPPKAGKYTLTFACDYAAKDNALWALRGTHDELSNVPKIKIEAKVEVEVKP